MIPNPMEVNVPYKHLGYFVVQWWTPLEIFGEDRLFLYFCILIINLKYYFFLVFKGTCLWVKSEIQRGEVHHRTSTYDQRQRVGLTCILNLYHQYVVLTMSYRCLMKTFFWPWSKHSHSTAKTELLMSIGSANVNSQCYWVQQNWILINLVHLANPFKMV